MAEPVETVNLGQFEKKFFQHLNELRLENLFCDVSFNVNGTIMPCHRLVMATISPYFKTMFNGNFKESNSNTITIKDVETEAFEEILNAMYTASIRFRPSNAYLILKTSHLLQLEIIEKACVTYIIKNPRICYLVDTCVFARNIQQMELYSTCISSIVEDVVEYGKTDSFKKIPIDVLDRILSEVEFYETEEESIILLIMKWAKENEASRSDVQRLLDAANLKATKYLNSLVMTELLVTCDDKCINDGGNDETSQELDVSANLPLNLYLNAIDVKTGQKGWSVLKMSGELDKYSVSSFHPTNSSCKKVCKVGSKLYCFEFTEYLGERNIFSCYENDNTTFLPTPDRVISAFEIFAMDSSIYVMSKKRNFTVWLYDCELNSWLNILKKNTHESFYCNVSAWTFSDGVFYVIAERDNPKNSCSPGKYIFSITCRSLIVRRLTRVPSSHYEYPFICVFGRKVVVSGTWLNDGVHDTFMIFDITANQWSTDLKDMNGRRVNFRLFHYNGFIYAVENGRAMVPNEKYDLVLDKWINLPPLPKQLTISSTDEVVATGDVFGVEVNTP